MSVPAGALMQLYGSLASCEDPDFSALVRRSVVFDVDDVERMIYSLPGDAHLVAGPWSPPYDPTLYVSNELWFLVGADVPLQSAILLGAGGWDPGSGRVTIFPRSHPLVIEDEGRGLSDAAKTLSAMANELSGCRNVGVIDGRAPRQARRHRQGGALLLEWKILELFPRLRTVRSLTSEGGLSPRRYHTVRGHIKQTKWGKFWWHPFWRGRPDLGVITKDYRVRVEP